ncbi:VPLPA-CTERM sorting domain-containing protein [Methylomonas methanica]|uniref:PEP motif putative anchor domain protein n=1 Tax=Methylomonas methanica (strain DSM 25384 / MC09) TaxID=857087 RepID=F9ZZB7_METMM|nr:VPLPA-CTERM sorting domain-containing protein [Methylomonas methanica]AEG01143.1 PEP motif putative anchor domain protein [Methylomonas methanica MC09]
MKKIIASVVVLVGLVFASQANAHVGYRSLDVNSPFTDSVTSDFGWYEGTQPTLTNSHHLRWFSFTIETAGNYDISVASLGAGDFTASSRTVTGGTGSSFTSVGDLDVAFSLFHGLVPASSVESLTRTGTNPDGSPILGGFDVVGQGITTDGIQHSPSSLFAGDNTLTNSSGETGTISFITAVNQHGSGMTESLSNYFLNKGIYTMLVGGASEPLFDTDGITLLNDGAYGVVASFMATPAVQPVPVPGAVWLFGSALAGFVGFGRRKSLAA